MLLKVCVNGARKIDEHPALSLDPERIASECARAIEAGAGAIHVHPKDAHGEESLRAPDVDRWVGAMREGCPDTPIGVTTGEWAMPNVEERLAEIDAWTELPDFASVNWHEQGADEVAAKLVERGIGVEAGIWHEDGLSAWTASPVRTNCLRVLVEVQDMSPDAARETGRLLTTKVRNLEPYLSVLLHGEEQSTWACLELAVQLGLDTRIGLEDCLRLPDGTTPSDNAGLVRAALRIIDGTQSRDNAANPEAAQPATD